ncbi:proliferation marker protein Ki-67 [Kryptolebias marmoratus]|uniref:Marker of proliferation Ki-67 n=1 Tax=Kryptolebias marmoratus TaxID=37003 RepID=A0A3Q3AA26_KRYMA|nr:proliferation marker protein Ki-67 [Kryptolebias marmoratus]
MPLHGKIVVIKRSGVDGTEFPLTASCLFGRKPECDIRIQLPSVSKEHCRIDLNENKEVILTNLSSANPTCVNGAALHQSERLKHGDVITVVDRSFRFEYPPAPTPKKRSSTGAKPETLKVLRDQQVSDAVVAVSGERRNHEVSTGPHLKDGANIDNIQRSLEKTLEVESKEDGSQQQSKTNSPFGDLYQMIKKSLDVKTPRKSCASQVQTPSSKFCTPRPGLVLKKDEKSVNFTPKKDEAKQIEDPKGKSGEMPQSVKKQGKIVPVSPADTDGPAVERDEGAAKSEATSKQRRSSSAAQMFTVSEVLELIPTPTSKSPTRRRSKETGLAKTAEEQEQQAMKSPKTTTPKRTSPRNSGTAEKVEKVSKKRKSGELASDLPAPKTKKKRVSFGGLLSPELFDKRLPPDSPLRRGATPRRSFSLCKPKLSLLRRASVIGFLKEKSPAKSKTPSPKKPLGVKGASPKTPPKKKSPKSGSPSPKPVSSAKKSSPKATSPGKRTPKSASPVQKSPRSRSASPKAVTPAKTSPKSKSRSSTPAQEKSQSRNKVETPKANKEPKTQCESASPGQQAFNATPTDKRRSSLRKSSPTSLKNVSLSGVTPAQTPSNSGVGTPMIQGRFSVSRISTPSPTSGADDVTQQEPLATVTPKIQLKRKSMKSASRRTPVVSRSARKILQRKSGTSRASMKVINSWADIVKFGQAKTQVVAPTQKKVTQKAIKKQVPTLQTPARKLKGHVSTGHADSPVTIVVGRAHKRTVGHPTGAAPRMVTNTALCKKDMKMDENFSGISEMFKTPANGKKRRSLITESNATKTPAGAQGTSMIEPSLLNTPEEPGEMVVSPLSLASTVKSRRYNSEAVQRLLIEDQESSFISSTPALDVHSKTSVTTPKQKPELPECLTGVKKIMKTPEQKAEPVEDLRGELQKTPKQKLEQPECLTGVKRIMKTPRQKAEPLEDIRGKLLITPRQKPEQQECLTGVKRMFKTPKQKAESLEDLRGKPLKTPKTREASEVSLDGVKELLETPVQVQKSNYQPEMTNVKTPVIKLFPVVNLTRAERVMKTPKEKYSPVEDMVGVKRLMRTPKQKGEPVEENFGISRLMKSPRLRGVAPVEDFEGLQELMQEPLMEKKTNEVTTETPLQEAAEAPQQQPEEETSASKATEMDPSSEKKPVRGRKAKTVKLEKDEDKKDVPEPSEDPAISAPVRGRRGKKCEAAAPPVVRHATRGRNAETTKNIDPTVEESAPRPSKAAPRPKRGRNAKKAPEDSADPVVIEEEVTPEPKSDPKPSTHVEHEVRGSDAHLEKAELKPKRGKKSKQPAEQQQNELSVQTQVPPAEASEDTNEAHIKQPKVSSGAMEALVQVPEVENSPHVEEVKEMSTAPVQKKSVRGRRAKPAESKEAEDKQEAAEQSDNVVSAPVRGRRGKKTEATAPPAVKQITRTRNAKSQESASDQPAVEAQVTTEVSTEAVSAQTSLNTTQETKDSAPPTKEVTQKVVRGRKTKLTPAESEHTDEVSSDHVVNAQPPQPVSSAAGKPKRGRKMRSDPEEQKEVVENTVVIEEIKQQFQPPVRAKRGRTAQHKEEEQMENSVKTTSQETSDCQEPVKKSRRTRKSEQEPKEEVQMPPAEPVMMPKQAAVAAKPRKGGRKAKPDTTAAAPVDSTEVIEVPVVSTDKPKGGRRGKRITQEVVAAENPKCELEEQNNTNSPPKIIKASRARGRKSESSQDISAKRARRGAASPVEETSDESAMQTSAPSPAPVKPAKRGKQSSAKPTRAKEAPVTNDPANPSEDLSKAAAENSKNSKKFVKFNSDLQILEIPKATPIKADRGRKPKLAGVKSNNASKAANKPEEESLSEVVKAQPVRRGRRGVKFADVTAKSTGEEGPNKTEAEPQPKTRRGRSAKK